MLCFRHPLVSQLKSLQGDWDAVRGYLGIFAQLFALAVAHWTVLHLFMRQTETDSGDIYLVVAPQFDKT